MNRHAFLRAAATAVVGVAVAGCGQLRPSQKVDIYEATLSGAQEVPPNASGATGTAEVQLNTNTNIVTWKVQYTGLSAPPTGAHIHGPAEPGQNAAVVIPFAGPLGMDIRGQAPVTPAHIADLAAGRWYVNIHSGAFPGGEIRGQLRRRQ